MVGVLWSTGGWQHATYASAEVRDPRRTLPLAMIIGTAAVTLIYILVNVAYMFLLTPQEIAASPRVAADAVSRVFGTAGGTAISLAIFVSTFGVVGIYTLTAPRIYFAMANEGLFFKRVAEVHPRFRTPAFAILGAVALGGDPDPVLGHVREPDLLRRLHRLDLLRPHRRERVHLQAPRCLAPSACRACRSIRGRRCSSWRCPRGSWR